MEKKIVCSAHIGNYNCKVRLIVLYDDDSCEQLFVYDDNHEYKVYGTMVTGKTRNQAIERLKQYRADGKICGYIPGEESE